MPLFARSKYQDDKGIIHPIRLSYEHLHATFGAPLGDITSRVPVKVTKGPREYGLSPRGLELGRYVTTATGRTQVYKFLPLLRQGDTSLSFVVIGYAWNVGEVEWEVLGIKEETFA